MKRVACLVFVLAMILAASVAVCEDSMTWHIAGKNVAVDIPFEIMCVSRESDETNPYYATGIYEYAVVRQKMEELDIYLYGKTTDLAGEIALSISEYNGEELRLMDEAAKAVLRQQLAAYYSAKGAKGIQCETITGTMGQAVCIHCLYHTGQGTQYEAAYYTTHETNLLGVRYLSFSTISEDRENMVRGIFESVRWEAGTDESERKGGMNSDRAYTDPETGVSFLVPEGWEEVHSSSTDPTIDAEYRIGTGGIRMVYGSVDLWEQIAAYNDVSGMSRADIGNEILSKEAFAQQFGCSEDDITIKTIGGQAYYFANTSYTVSIGQITQKSDILFYACVKNAYYYKFGLGGYGAAEYAEQFEQFMESVTMP